MVKKKTLGAGAKCSALIKYLHPSDLVKQTLVNARHNQRLNNLLAIRVEEKKVNRRDQSCVVYRHDQFDGRELHSVVRFCRVEEEGHPDHFFYRNDDENKEDGDDKEKGDRNNEISEDEIPAVPLPEAVRHMGNSAEDIALVRAMGLMVDDDNEPAPENVPDGVSDDVSSGGK